MSAAPSSTQVPPLPGQASRRTAGTGQGSESALDAMLKKRREAADRISDELCQPEAVKAIPADK